jgi:hypothetical protein
VVYLQLLCGSLYFVLSWILIIGCVVVDCGSCVVLYHWLYCSGLFSERGIEQWLCVLNSGPSVVLWQWLYICMILTVRGTSTAAVFY